MADESGLSKKVSVLTCLIAVVVCVCLALVLDHFWINPPREGESTPLGIDTLAEKVRSEMENIETWRQSNGKAALFELKDFELEISFVVKRSNKVKGDLEAEVVTVGGESEHSKEATQKVVLHMGVIPAESVKIAPVSH
ncbi:MAG: trypco2 family protein, partial [Candidatus Sulfotelmatobacter sp.]